MITAIVIVVTAYAIIYISMDALWAMVTKLHNRKMRKRDHG